MSILDQVREILVPGDLSRTTINDLPVDVSPRYVIEQNIIPFRSVRSPELTPIRAVDVVLRTPFKSWAPVRGRARNIPDLPSQAGTRVWPMGADPDMISTGFSGLVPTINRSFGAVGLGEEPPGPLPPSEPKGTRVQACAALTYDSCGKCCDDSFPHRPFKRIRCKKKCKTAPTQSMRRPSSSTGQPSPVPSFSGFPGYPGFDISDAATGIPAYTNPITGRKNYSPTFGHYNRPRKAFYGVGWSPGAWVLGTGGGPPARTVMPEDINTNYYVESVACESWFKSKDANNQCQWNMLKLGLVAAAAALVMMK